MKTTTTLLSAVLAMTISLNSSAQDIYLDASTNGMTLYTDGASFYDSGRDNDRYTNFENFTTTICSNSGAQISVEFSEFHVETGKDMLYILDGEGPLQANVAGSPFTGEDIAIERITSTGSCLSFRFVSDFNVMRSGWEASIEVEEPMVQAMD